MKVRINYDTPIEIRDVEDFDAFLNILVAGGNTIKEVRIEIEKETTTEPHRVVPRKPLSQDDADANWLNNNPL